MSSWLAASPIAQAAIVLGVSTVAGTARLASIVVRHLCDVHFLHEQVKAAAELTAAGLAVQVQLGPDGKPKVSAATPRDEAQ
jgi:hypothetical protein